MWNIKKLLLCHILIACLIGSWYLPQTRVFWDWLDVAIFRAFNNTLPGNPRWQCFWAVANHRWADWFEDVVLLAFFILSVKQVAPEMRRRQIASFLFCILFSAALIYFFNQILLRDYIVLYRASPAKFLEGAFRLSKTFPWLKHLKDAAPRCFPGDHATTAFLFAFFYAFFSSKRLTFFAGVYTVFLIMPRLIAGAHWFSDIVMGSGCIVLFFAGWALFTPLHKRTIDWIEFLFSKLKTYTGSSRSKI